MPLIDRIRAVLAEHPGLPLALLCAGVGDSRPEMVATLRRMVELTGCAKVQASEIQNSRAGTCHAAQTGPLGSLPVSSADAGGR